MPVPSPAFDRAAALATASSKAAGDPPAIPAATVVPVRLGPAGTLEVLMLRRNSSLTFAGGMWVFPGGRLDDTDHAGADDLETAARRAATREAGEEAGLALDPDELVWFAHWTPPQVTIKRFATFFFVAHAPVDDAGVTIDGGEIHEHGWFAPRDALARRNALEIELSPPTWITLEQLARADEATPDGDVAAVVAHLAGDGPEFFETRIVMAGDAAVALYVGDAGYEPNDAEVPGGRHRLWMAPEGWRYERDDWD